MALEDAAHVGMCYTGTQRGETAQACQAGVCCCAMETECESVCLVSLGGTARRLPSKEGPAAECTALHATYGAAQGLEVVGGHCTRINKQAFADPISHLQLASSMLVQVHEDLVSGSPLAHNHCC